MHVTSKLDKFNRINFNRKFCCEKDREKGTGRQSNNLIVAINVLFGSGSLVPYFSKLCSILVVPGAINGFGNCALKDTGLISWLFAIY